MTQKHPITPSPELVQQWVNQFVGEQVCMPEQVYIATQAAQWGADQELESCCAWVDWKCSGNNARQLREDRRPKPTSLKEQALEELHLTADPNGAELSQTQVELIRRALEQLSD